MSVLIITNGQREDDGGLYWQLQLFRGVGKTKGCIPDVNLRTVAGKVFLSAFVGFRSYCSLSILKKGTEKSLRWNTSSVEGLPQLQQQDGL